MLYGMYFCNICYISMSSLDNLIYFTDNFLLYNISSCSVHLIKYIYRIHILSKSLNKQNTKLEGLNQSFICSLCLLGSSTNLLSNCAFKCNLYENFEHISWGERLNCDPEVYSITATPTFTRPLVG